MIRAVPRDNPVAIPEEEPIGATEELLLVHVPPEVASVKEVVKPRHKCGEPVIAPGELLTVTTDTTTQLVPDT